MTGSGEPARLQGSVVSANLFPLLGVSPILGRGFAENEDKPSENGRVVILSQDLFQRRFNSDPALLNQPITLDGTKYTVVGVMPRSFQFPIQNQSVELWTTIAGDASGEGPMTNQRGAHFLNLIARLKQGVTEEQAQSDVSLVAGRLEQQYPDTNTHKGIHIESALHSIVGDIRPALLILLGAVACVLLIACANVANLLLARATGRYKEMAIRSALGASRIRVIRQLLTESVLLSLVGGGVGLMLAVWWSDLLVALGKEDIPRAVQVGLDWRVLSFTLSVSVLTGLVFGLVPAFHSSKTELTDSLKEGRGVGGGARRNRMTMVVRTSVDPNSVVPAIRSKVFQLDTELPLQSVRTLDRVIANSIGQQRFTAVVLSVFAAVALLLAIAGLYGVISYAVSQRTRELGIRIALGARVPDVLVLVLKEGMTFVLVGELVGLAGAYGLTRLLRGFLFEVTPTDALTFITVTIVLSGIALLACYIPARRATRVDPLEALRCE